MTKQRTGRFAQILLGDVVGVQSWACSSSQTLVLEL
jgi:hypothetical protein